MSFEEFYIADKEGKSNCIIRTFCKLFNKDYEVVKEELLQIADEYRYQNYAEMEVFEKYLSKHNYKAIPTTKDVCIKDLKLPKSKYVIFCYDKKDYYHMFPIINNIYYDKNRDSINLFVLKIYKEAII